MKIFTFSFWNHHFLATCVGLFILSRAFIWTNPPPSFSEIIYSYMPYAHLWASGVQPYRQQWYEYPPATIPLFYFPHLVDVATHGEKVEANWYHMNYSQVYRGQLLAVDILLFALILLVNKKFVKSQNVKWLNIMCYLLVTTKAHHFLYDTMDLTFAAALTLSAVAPLVWKTEWVKDGGKWLGFWLGSALKLVNLPLGLAQFFHVWPIKIKQLAFMVVTAGIVWGVPLFLYRSSLQVILVYHQQRGVQVDSVPGIVLRVASRFTHSEEIIEVYKNYEISGPLTAQFLPYISIFQFACFALFGIWAGWKMWRLSEQHQKDIFLLSSTLGFVILFLLVGKVQSTPFLLWLLPLIACYRWPTFRTQSAAWMTIIGIIFVSMTRVANTELGILTLPILVGIVRSSLLFSLFIIWLKSLNQTITFEAQTPSIKTSARHR